MATDVETRRTGGTSATEVGIVDCDVHVVMDRPEQLDAHLPERWRRYRETFGNFTFEAEFYPRQHANSARSDAWPPSGRAAGADIDFVREQLLDRWNIETAILNPFPYPAEQRNPGYANALATAWNEWQLEHWVGPEPRFLASVFVNPDDPDAAVAEIERRAGDPRFAHVFLVAGTNEPAGKRRYWKVYEAAAASGFPVAFHFAGYSGYPNTGAGYVSYYLESHIAATMMLQDQLTSLVFEGTFEAMPDLQVVSIECGFAWLEPLMWRLDRAWKKLHAEVPHVRNPPSQYLREQVWLTTQPMEEPPRSKQFLDLLEHTGMPDRLLFATDYPHWDFDSPDAALPRAVPEAVRSAIMGRNARALYRLDQRVA